MRTYTTQRGATAHLKDASVDMQGTVPGSVDPIIDAAAPIYTELGHELIVTSAADGKHMQGSLHYEGKALDLKGESGGLWACAYMHLPDTHPLNGGKDYQPENGDEMPDSTS